MKKTNITKIFTILLLMVMSSGIVFANQTEVAGSLSGTISKEGAIANSDKNPVLQVEWLYRESEETYSIGFTETKPAADLNVAWTSDSFTPATTLRIKNDDTNNNVNQFKAIGSVYAYCNIYSNQGFKVTMKANGPLKANAPDDANFTNLINWTATWSPVEVSTAGSFAAGKPVSLGRNTNEFGAIQFSDSAYTGSDTAYTTEQVLFKQDAGEYAHLGKYGYAKIDIETQNTRGLDNPKKDDLVYAGKLILTVTNI